MSVSYIWIRCDFSPLVASLGFRASLFAMVSNNSTGANTSAVASPCYSGSELMSGICGGSGAGICDNLTGSCLCNPGWSGHADMVTMDLTHWNANGKPLVLDCPTSDIAMKVMWSVPLVAMLILVPIIPAYVRKQCAAYRKNSKIKHWWQHPPLGIAMAMLLQVLCLIILCILKIIATANAGAVIGVDPAVTILFAVVCWLLYATGGWFQYYTFKNTAFAGKSFGSSKEKAEGLLKKVKLGMFLTWGMLCVLFVPLVINIGIHPSINIDVTNVGETTVPAVEVVFFQIFFAGHVVVMIGTVGVSQYLKVEITKMFEGLMSGSSLKEQNERMEATRKLLEAGQIEIRNQMGFNAILHLVFAAIPPLWNKTSYFFPIACVSMVLGAQKSLATLANATKKGQGKRGNSSSNKVTPSGTDSSAASTGGGATESQ